MALWGGRFYRRQTSGLNNSMIRCASITVWRRRGYCRFCGTVQSIGLTGVLTADEQRRLEEALSVLLEEGSRESQQILQNVRKDIP